MKSFFRKRNKKAHKKDMLKCFVFKMFFVKWNLLIWATMVRPLHRKEKDIHHLSYKSIWITLLSLWTGKIYSLGQLNGIFRIFFQITGLYFYTCMMKSNDNIGRLESGLKNSGRMLTVLKTTLFRNGMRFFPQFKKWNGRPLSMDS